MIGLNIVMPEREPETVKKYVKVLTAEVTPEKQKPNGFVKAKPNGFHKASVDVIEQTRTWDGFRTPPPSFPPPTVERTTAPPPQVIATAPTVKEPTADTTADDWTRERDDVIPADQWHDGEPYKPTAKPSGKLRLVDSFAAKLEVTRKAQAVESVRVALDHLQSRKVAK
jgi:hypothetical protein